MTRIAAVQLAPEVGRLDANLRAARTAISESVSGGADIVLLPELVTSGYVFDSPAEAASLAMAADDQRLLGLADSLAGNPDAVAVLGFAEAAGDVLHNSAIVLSASGPLAVYRKAHLWDREKLVFRAGDAPPPVVDTAHGRLAVLVCYDLEFPEWSRAAAVAGADLIAVPTNWPLFPRPDGERVAEVQIAIATARMNHVAVAFADRSGIERGVAWSEGTGIVGADGWLRSSVGAGTGTAWADLDLTESRDKGQSELADLFADRRPELYRRALGL